MKKIFLIFSFFSIFFILSNTAMAAGTCSWTKSTGIIVPGTTGAVWSCPDSNTEESVNVSSCSGGQPGLDYLCCCPKNQLVVATTDKAPIFSMPDFQVQIPGLNKLATITCPAAGDCNIPWLGQYIAGIYNYALAIVGIIAALVLMGGGLLWLVSGGDASRISQAKELIIGSITGLVILSASYIILLQVNPNLVNLKSIAVKYIPKIENLAVSRNNSTAGDYRNSPCATDAELASGINFYATGYYKPTWEDSDTFRCVVAMQCSCPSGYGRDMTKNCDALYGKTFPNYHPCVAFPANTPYCNMTKSGSSPKAGDIAGPGNCTANLPTGSKVCFKGNTYTITDTGSGIQGKRLDIWSGSDLDQANKNTGVGLFKKGACN